MDGKRKHKHPDPLALVCCRVSPPLEDTQGRRVGFAACLDAQLAFSLRGRLSEDVPLPSVLAFGGDTKGFRLTSEQNHI